MEGGPTKASRKELRGDSFVGMLELAQPVRFAVV
jgi:hypothetical protein